MIKVTIVILESDTGNLAVSRDTCRDNPTLAEEVMAELVYTGISAAGELSHRAKRDR